MTAAVATTIGAVAGINTGAMIQVAEIEAKAAAAVADLIVARRAIAVQRPCAAARMATAATTVETDQFSIVHPAAFAMRTAGAAVIETGTKIAAAIRAATRAKIRIGTRTKTAAVIGVVIVAVTGAAIEIAIKIA